MIHRGRMCDCELSESTKAFVYNIAKKIKQRRGSVLIRQLKLATVCVTSFQSQVQWNPDITNPVYITNLPVQRTKYLIPCFLSYEITISV